MCIALAARNRNRFSFKVVVQKFFLSMKLSKIADWFVCIPLPGTTSDVSGEVLRSGSG